MGCLDDGTASCASMREVAGTVDISIWYRQSVDRVKLVGSSQEAPTASFFSSSIRHIHATTTYPIHDLPKGNEQ